MRTGSDVGEVVEYTLLEQILFIFFFFMFLKYRLVRTGSGVDGIVKEVVEYTLLGQILFIYFFL